MTMLEISSRVQIPEREIEFRATRAGGPGGQHVNKTSSAIQLRFDIRTSSLPEFYKRRLLALRDHRITRDGVILIRADGSRSQAANREAALERLRELIRRAGITRKKRRPTRPSKRAKARRVQEKKQRGRNKQLRKPPPRD